MAQDDFAMYGRQEAHSDTIDLDSVYATMDSSSAPQISEEDSYVDMQDANLPSTALRQPSLGSRPPAPLPTTTTTTTNRPAP